ncbi:MULTISPECIES: hypothetical protein [Fischerella]|nr:MULTISPECIES: hypothetical protein [Fischerella]
MLELTLYTNRLSSVLAELGRFRLLMTKLRTGSERSRFVEKSD